MKRFYKVSGKVKENGRTVYYHLGYVGSKSACIEYLFKHGWSKNQLIFTKG
jgi:hypothetical protein